MSKKPTRSGYIGADEPMLKVAIFMPLFVVCSLFIIFTGVAGAVSQGYQSTNSNLQDGMVVRLSPDSSPSQLLVQPTDSTVQSAPLGIATQVNASLLAVGNSASNVFITSSGKATAYVSDLGGTISKGDLLSPSPLSGVLQKSTSASTISVGTALEALPADAQSTTVKGSKNPAHIALIGINVDIKSTGQSKSDQDFLQSFGRTITGRSINQLRVLAAFIIFTVLLIVEAVIIHATISSTINAAGRNPMARGVIEQQSIKGVLIAVVVLLTSIATISIILWA